MRKVKQNLTTTLKGGMYAFNFDIWLWGSSSNVAGRTIFVVEKKKVLIRKLRGAVPFTNILKSSPLGMCGCAVEGVRGGGA